MKKIEKRLIVIGAGGHGRAVAEAAQISAQWDSIVFLDDDFPAIEKALSWPVLGQVADMALVVKQDDECIVAIGNQTVRQRLQDELVAAGLHLCSVIHPHAWVSPVAEVGAGVAIMAGAVVGCQARVDRGAIVNANATVDHDAVLEEFAHIGVGVQLAGGVVVRKRAWLQAGCSAGYRVVVPEDAVIAPGTALRDD